MVENSINVQVHNDFNQILAQWKNTGGVTRRTLQTFRMATN